MATGSIREKITKKGEIRYQITDMVEYGSVFQNLGFVIRQKDGSPISPNALTYLKFRYLFQIKKLYNK